MQKSEKMAKKRCFEMGSLESPVENSEVCLDCYIGHNLMIFWLGWVEEVEATLGLEKLKLLECATENRMTEWPHWFVMGSKLKNLGSPMKLAKTELLESEA